MTFKELLYKLEEYHCNTLDCPAIVNLDGVLHEIHSFDQSEHVPSVLVMNTEPKVRWWVRADWDQYSYSARVFRDDGLTGLCNGKNFRIHGPYETEVAASNSLQRLQRR